MMTLLEDNTQVFIVRVWLERRELEGSAPQWRGVIQQVPSGERRYFRNLDDITAFIAPYLEEMGVKPSFRARVRQWLKRWRLFPKRRD
jgi:hypothetical protein